MEIFKILAVCLITAIFAIVLKSCGHKNNKKNNKTPACIYDCCRRCYILDICRNTDIIICFYVNSGIIRSFIVEGLVCGAVLYLKALSVYYIKYGVRLVGILLKPLKMLVSVIRIVLQSLRKDRPKNGEI